MQGFSTVDVSRAVEGNQVGMSIQALT